MAELIWEGKYRADGKRAGPVRLALPFQTVETVNESALNRRRTLDLFSSGKPSEWRNRLVWGDKKYVLPSLLPEFAGKVDLVYIDPPFLTGADFSFTAGVPGSEVSIEKKPSIIEQKAYRDTWGRGLDSYLQWFHECALLLRELLAETGTLYVHLDWHIGSYAKAILDEVFGLDSAMNEIAWRRTNARSTKEMWPRIHDSIYVYKKGERFTFQPQLIPADKEKLPHTLISGPDGKKYQTFELTAPGVTSEGESGRKWRGFDPGSMGRHWGNKPSVMEEWDKKGLIHWPANGGFPRRRAAEPFNPDSREVVVGDVWSDLDRINQAADERVGYPTQKPEALLARILKASSNEGDLVLDCFCGSGTTAVAAEKLGRRWVVADLGRFAVHTTRKRLLGLVGLTPFVVQNLGKYERQAWMTEEFAKPEDRAATEAAYRRFILDLYGAEPFDGNAWLHGLKAGRMVHVGAVDAPVTVADVKAVAREVWRSVPAAGGERKAAADILGWEFAFEINETAKQLAAEARVDVKFRRIPREVLEKAAVDQGDIQAKDFFELRALSTKVTRSKRQVTVELTDFVLPSEDLPAEIARAVKHWSQWIDYWAIDWDFKGDTFHNQWQSFRTGEQPKLALKIASPDYEQPGKYAVVVKVIDILGNDTTKVVEVEVK